MIRFPGGDMPAQLNTLLKRNALPLSLMVLPQDASRRCYYRLQNSTHKQTVPLIMECPPSEKPDQFCVIADYLNMMGLRAPKILDQEGDFFLLEDFGKGTFRHFLIDTENAQQMSHTLYHLALDVLLECIKKATHKPPFLPEYTQDIFLEESYVFTTWALDLHARDHPFVLEYEAIWRALLSHVNAPSTFVHRDFHIDNLFYLKDSTAPAINAVRQCGIIDFQDGLWGPVGYDLVSLINDARIDVPHILREQLMERYLTFFPSNLHQNLLTQFTVMDMHRHMRIVGVFNRLKKRDGKTHYEQYLPRVWEYIRHHLHNPLFIDLKKWLVKHDCA